MRTVRFKCAWYHYKNKTMGKNSAYTLLTAAFCVCLIASNIFETVIFEAGSITLTGGFLIFPVSYIINDCLSEVYGYRKARFAILLAFALNLSFVLTAQLVALLPESGIAAGLADGGMTPRQHFVAVFKADFRITAASMAAFLAGSLMNARVMVALKHWMSARSSASPIPPASSKSPDDLPGCSMKGFGIRAILSSLAGESLDSIVFFPIAFFGVGFRSCLILMLTQVVLKTVYEVVALPLTTLVVKRLKSMD